MVGPSGRSSRRPEQRRLVLDQVREAREELADEALRDLTVQYLAIIAAMTVLSAPSAGSSRAGCYGR